jgi:enterochelin esterase family protein
MKPTLILAFSLGGACCLPAQSAADAKPAATNVMGAAHPRIDAAGRGIFQLKAPEAKKVAVDLPQGDYEMTRGEDGVWRVTTPPLEPGFHYYTLSVDGLSINDPGSHTFFGAGRDISGIEVPEPGVDYHLLKDVPHGDLRIRPYFSKITGQWRRCFVYTPPGYGSDTATRYPVLYLQHGSAEDESGWTFQGKANLILDNLIAEKKAVPMIIVMDNCYAAKAGEAPGPRGATGAFQDVMIREIIPMIDSTFRTLADREHRAMAGLSMGGNMTFRVTVPNLDKFAYIGSFSGTMNGLSTDVLDPATAFDGAFKDGEAFNRKVKVLWIGMGTVEPDPFPAAIGAFKAMLDKAGIHYVTFESPGTRHEWLTWRRSLHDFAPRLFR